MAILNCSIEDREFEILRFTYTNGDEVAMFLGSAISSFNENGTEVRFVNGHGELVKAYPGSWVIKYKGHFFTCSDSLFSTVIENLMGV